MDDWIEWKGGDCPVEDGVMVCVKFRNLDSCGAEQNAIGFGLRWSHLGTDGDIVAYKVADSTLIDEGTIPDSVNHPSHYTAGKVECIDALESATVNLQGIEAVCTANAIKYIWRWKQKNGIEDLRKARWYINKLIGDSSDS